YMMTCPIQRFQVYTLIGNFSISPIFMSCYIFFSRLQPPQSSTLFPYTTLFRSSASAVCPPGGQAVLGRDRAGQIGVAKVPCAVRSEEHTSELQSLAYLVCRLLLEKKKK